MGKNQSKYKIKCEMTFPYFIKFKKRKTVVHQDYIYSYYYPKKKVNLFKLDRLDSVVFKFYTSYNDRTIPLKFNPTNFETHQRENNFVKEISHQINGTEKYILRITHKNIIKELVRVYHK